jgi:hypothetical protein
MIAIETPSPPPQRWIRGTKSRESAGLFTIYPGSNPLQLDPTQACVIDITFVVSSAAQGTTATTTTTTDSPSGMSPQLFCNLNPSVINITAPPLHA